MYDFLEEEEQEQEDLGPYRKALETFLASDEFYESLLKATRASWSGSGYSVELFNESHSRPFRVLWNNEIGNLYRSPGIILGLPTLDDTDLSAFIAAKEQEEQHLDYTDDDVLRAVDREARRNTYLKQTLVEASRRGDEEVVENTLHQVLASLSLNVNDFFSFLQKAIHWFIANKEQETGQSSDEHTYPPEWEGEYFGLVFDNEEEELKDALRSQLEE